jgi:F0F1-type ATP synthase epsilon subunit
MTFKMIISTPEKTFYKGPAVLCRVETPAGSIGFEAKHEPFLGVLKENSSLYYKTDSDKENKLDVTSGILLFNENSCIITGEINE